MAKEFLKKEINRILYVYREIINAFCIMMDNKQQMDFENKVGRDNFFHHKACKESSQRSITSGIASQFFGIAKEGIDVVKKVIRNPSLTKEILKDCQKDLKNNFQGFLDGSENWEAHKKEKMFNFLRKIKLYK